MSHCADGEPLPQAYLSHRCLRRLLPDQDILYFADRASFPHGGKGRPELLTIMRRTLRYLHGFDPAMGLIALIDPMQAVARWKS